MEHGVGSNNGTRMNNSDTRIHAHVIMANEKGCHETSGKLLDLSLSLLPRQYFSYNIGEVVLSNKRSPKQL